MESDKDPPAHEPLKKEGDVTRIETVSKRDQVCLKLSTAFCVCAMLAT